MPNIIGINKEKVDSENQESRLLLRPCLVVLSGPPLTGKSLMADRLVRHTNLELIDVDEVRNEIDETRKTDGLVRLLEPDKEREVMVDSYTIMCQQAEERIRLGIPVIIAGTFSREEFKKPLEELLGKLKLNDTPFKIFLLTATDEEVERRIEKRQEEGSLSNINTLDKYKWAKGFFKPIEFAPITEIDTTENDCVDQVIEKLQDFKK